MFTAAVQGKDSARKNRDAKSECDLGEMRCFRAGQPDPQRAASMRLLPGPLRKVLAKQVRQTFISCLQLCSPRCARFVEMVEQLQPDLLAD